MAEGDVRLNIGINLDEVENKLDKLESKLLGLPDVKANIEVTATGADQQLQRVQQRLQRKAGSLEVKAKANFDELTNLDSAIGVVKENLQTLVTDAARNPIKPKIDSSGLIDLDTALNVAVECFNELAQQINATVIKPKVDLSELIELNKELDRKQEHWQETQQLFRQRPVSGRVEIRASDRAGQTQTVRPTRQPAAPRPTPFPGLTPPPPPPPLSSATRAPLAPPPPPSFRPSAASVRGPRALPAARAGFFDRQVLSSIGRDIKMLLSTFQSRSGVLANFRDDAGLQQLLREMQGPTSQRSAAPQGGRARPAIIYGTSEERNRKMAEKNWNELITKSRYSYEQIEEAFDQLRKINEGLLPSNLKQKPGLKPGQQVNKRETPDIQEASESGRVVRQYVKNRMERITGVRSSTPPVIDVPPVAPRLLPGSSTGMLALPPASNAVVSRAVTDAVRMVSDQLTGNMARINRREIGLNPRELQYKMGSNKKGEVGSLSDVETWDDDLAGVLSVWRDPRDGKTYVVNGHNRLALAEKLGVEELNVRYIDAKNVAEARRIGAMQNIASGAGTAVDAAKFFRDTGIRDVNAIKKVGLPLSSGMAGKGLSLASLPSEIFDQVVRGELSIDRAAILGNSGLSEDAQREALKFAGKPSKTSNRQLQELVDIRRYGEEKKTVQDTILGLEEIVESDLRERIKVTDGVKSALRGQKRLFSVVAKNAEVLSEQGGNVINVDENQEIANAADKILKTFDSIKFTSSAITQAINQGIAKLKEGENMPAIMRDILPNITSAVEQELEAIFGKARPETIEEAGTPLFDTQPAVTPAENIALAKREAQRVQQELQRQQQSVLVQSTVRDLALPDIASFGDEVSPDLQKIFAEVDEAFEAYSQSGEKWIEKATKFREAADAVADDMDSLEAIGEEIAAIDSAIKKSIKPVNVQVLGDALALPGSDALPVNAEVVGATPFDQQPKRGGIADAFKKVIDELRASDVRHFSAIAEQLFESKWALGGVEEWKGLDKGEARQKYIEEWQQRLFNSQKAIGDSVSQGGALLSGGDGTIAGAFREASERLIASDKRLGDLSEQVVDLSRKVADTLGSGESRETAQDVEKLYPIRLGKKQLEGLNTALQTDIDSANTHGAALKEAGIKLSTSMKLTARQLSTLVKELDQSAILDDIDNTIGEYPELANAKAAFGKMRELAFKEGLIRRGSEGQVEVIDQAATAGQISSAQPKAFDLFANFVKQAVGEYETSRPYKPSSRMFGGPMSDWTPEQLGKYKEAQSTFRAWDKESKTVNALNTAVEYNEDFKKNFASMALEGMAGLLEGRKGGLAAKTTSDFASALSAQTGRDVPDTRKELASELRGLSGQAAESFIAGILDEKNSSTDAGSRLAFALIQGIKAALQMKSPSRLLIALGREAGLSVLIGWEQVMDLLKGRIESSLNKVFDYAVKTPAGAGVDYSTLIGSIADLTIDPPLYQKRLESVGLQNMPSQLLSEASARGTFQDFFPEAKIERTARQLPGTLERLIDGAFTKSFNQYSSSRFVASDLAPTQAIGAPSSPLSPGMLRSGTGRIRGRLPAGVGGASLPLFDVGSRVGPIPDPWESSTYSMQDRTPPRAPQPPMRQLLLPPARRPEPTIASVFETTSTEPGGFTPSGSYSMGASAGPSEQNMNRAADAAMGIVDQFLSSLESLGDTFNAAKSKVQGVGQKFQNAVSNFAGAFANNFGGGGAGGSGGGSGGGSTGAGVTGGLGGPGGQRPPGGGDFAFNDWLDEVLPSRGTGSRQGFNNLIDALREVEREAFAAGKRVSAFRDQMRYIEGPDGERVPDPDDEAILNDLLAEQRALERQVNAARTATNFYGSEGSVNRFINAQQQRATVDPDSLEFEDAGAFNAEGSINRTLKSIQDIYEQFDKLRRLFANVDTSGIIDTNNALQSVEQSIREIRNLADQGLIDPDDLALAEAGARRTTTELQAQAAATRGLAKEFEALGIQSESSIQATRRIRDEANRAIQASGLSDAEKARANNARDIQELSYLQEQIRGAQGASGFGGFRGREIGDEVLNRTLQRTELMNFRRNLEEAKANMRLSPDPAGGFLNENSYRDAMGAIDRQIANADRAFRVLNDTATDGERAFETLRNAFGVFSDDLGNLIPQLIAFDFAFNILYSTLLPLPRIILQTTAEFDRLDTSISTYLRNTRGITDSTEVLKELRQQSLDLGTSYQQTAQSYLSFAAALKGTRLEGQETDITRTLATSGRNMGLSGEQLGRVSSALTQIVGKGTVQMEELRQQLAEQMPGAIQIAARAFGVTTEELYKMVGAGQIAGDEFVDKFIKQLKAEGGSINALSGSFSNLQEQLSAVLEQFGAVAGQPLFAPLTLALQGLVTLLKQLIPLAGVLSVGALVLGSNMAKGALGIKSWRTAAGQLATAGLALASGDKAGAATALGRQGGPTYATPWVAAPQAPQPPQGMSNLGKVASGARQAVDGLKTSLAAVFAFGRQGGPQPGAPLGQMQGALTGLNAGLLQTGQGLKGAAAGMVGLGKATFAALAPVLKLYLAIEALTLLFKAFSGDLNPLKGAETTLEALTKGEGQENAAKFSRSDRFFASLNLGAYIGQEQSAGTTKKILDESGKVYKSLQQDGEAYAKWREEDTKLAIEEAALVNEAKLETNTSKREEIDARLRSTRQRRENLTKNLPFNPSQIAAAGGLLQQAQNNAKEQITRLLRTQGVGETDIKDFIAGQKELGQITNLNNVPARRKADIEAFRKDLGAAKELEKGIDSLTQRLKIYEQVRNTLPLTIGNIDQEIKATQERIFQLDLRSTGNRQEFDAGVRKVGALTFERELLSMSTEQQNIRLLEDRAKAEQAVAAAAQVSGQVRLEVLEGERRLLEANIELAQKRSQVSEQRLQNRASLSRQLGFEGDAIKAEKDLSALQARNRQAEIRQQRSLLTNDRQRFAIEREMRQAELRGTQAQLRAQAAQERERYVQLSYTAQFRKADTSPEGQRLSTITQRLADEALRTSNSLDAQVASYDKLIANADKLYQVNLQTAGVRARILDIEGQLARENSLSEQQRLFIEEQTNVINAQLKAAEQEFSNLDAQADRGIETMQERISLAEKYVDLLERENQVIQEGIDLDQQIADSRIQAFRDRDSDGFFTRMAAYGQTADQDVMSIGQERRRLMQEMADRQEESALLTLRLDEQRLKVEREIFNLEQQKARIALATQRAQLAAQLAILQLQLQEGIRSDQAAGRVDQQKIAARDQINAELARRGVPAASGGTAQADPNGIQASVTNLIGGFESLEAAERDLAASTSEANRQFDIAEASTRRVAQATAENIAKQRELAELDTIRWWNEFLDSLDGIGTVLGEATAGLSEFRRSVASAFARGLREGGIDEAISDAAGQLSDRIMTSIIDEFVLKPMERNLFAGIRALMGDGFKPPEKPEEIFRSGSEAVKQEIAKGLTIEQNTLTEIQNFHRDFNAAIERVFNKAWQPPAGPQQVGPGAGQAGGVANTVGGVANMLPGTKGGPNINEGVGWSAWRGRNHNGQDLGLDPGDPIHSRRAGTIKDFYSSGFGEVGGAVVVKYDDGTEGTYGHVNPMSGMRVGQPIAAGQRIATVTDDGQNTHLHYELRNALGQIQNPLEAIKQSLAVKPGMVTPPPAPVLPPAQAMGPTTNRLPVAGQTSSQVDGAMPPQAFPLPAGEGQGPIALEQVPWQQAGQQVNTLGIEAQQAAQGLSVLGQTLATATQPASGTVPGTATTPALPPAAAAPGSEVVADSQAFLAAANTSAAADIKKAGDAAKPVPGAFSGLGTAMGAAVGALGSIAMGIAGANQMQEGGTYNTLMGLAGIFGAVGGITGMFTPGGSLFGLFRANGGPVNARQPYIVGERGPELFMPDGAGQVMSSNDTNSLFKKTRAQLEATRAAMQQKNDMGFADFSNKPIDVRYESRVINGVEYVTTEQLRVATREAAERGKALAFQSMQGSVKTRRRLGL
jgi:tape measure domain-containing protein